MATGTRKPIDLAARVANRRNKRSPEGRRRERLAAGQLLPAT